ncbi:MAG TPA: glycosyltransferase family A protein [Roseiarcus sp.]|jgi:glycosyltransferase involved in cell wall biosynthesis
MRVSVLLACWNAAPYVGEAVQSVLDQRPAPFEVIAVDDGSTDRSAAILESFGTRLVLIRQANSGVGAALNRAAAEATGDVLAFIDADDLWTPGKLARQTQALAADPDLDAVFGLMETFASPDLPQEERSQLRVPDGPEPAFTKNGILIRRAAFNRLGGFDPERRNADFFAWYARAVGEGFQWRLLTDVVCRRRLHAQNMSRLDREQQRREYLATMKAFLDARRRSRASAS